MEQLQIDYSPGHQQGSGLVCFSCISGTLHGSQYIKEMGISVSMLQNNRGDVT